MTATVDMPARGEPWIRKAGELVGVSFPDRTIELIVIPYEHEITVPHPFKRDGGLVKEIINRGAFDGIERRANRVRCNREHEKTLTFGRVAAFRAGEEQGLHATIRVANTPLGEETLSLADDGCLDASAGFWPELDDRGRLIGLRWENPKRYRISKAFLDHVALVSDGAYGEKAGVLAVRNQAAPALAGEPATPALDALETEKWRQKLAEIDAKYLKR
jgi:HK97 family phage prohead protease